MMKTKLTVKVTSAFKKDYRIAVKRGLDVIALDAVIDMLANDEMLPAEYRDHELTGSWKGFRECHVKPDWLLIYRKDNDILVLTLTRTGSHSDLFGK